MNERKLLSLVDIRTFDTRNLAYRVNSVASNVDVVRKIWPAAKVALDQKNTGYCFGFAWASVLTCTNMGDRDVTKTQGFKFGSALYHETVRRLNSGIKTHSGITAIGDWAKEFGYIEEYRWATTMDELRDGVITLGPAAMAVPWGSENMAFGSDNRLAVKRRLSSWVASSGHALCIRGYDPKKSLKKVENVKAYTGPAFMLRNSWGPKWAQHGDCWISQPDLEYLMTVNGGAIEYSAAIAVGRPKKLVVSEVFKNGEL